MMVSPPFIIIFLIFLFIKKMGSQESSELNSAYPSVGPMSEMDEESLKEIHESYAQIVQNDKYFQKRSTEICEELNSTMHIDPSYYAALQYIAAQKEELDSESLSDSTKKAMFTSMNSKINEIICSTRQEVIKEMSRMKDINEMQKELERKRNVISKTKAEIEELKIKLAELQKISEERLSQKEEKNL